MQLDPDLLFAIDFIETLQAPYKAKMIGGHRLIDALAAATNDIEWASGHLSPMSRYEEPGWNYVVTTKVRRLIQTYESKRRVTPRSEKQPIFGTLLSGELNGRAIDIKSEKYYVVLVDDGLFSLTNLFSKIVARSMVIKHAVDGPYIEFTDDPKETYANIRQNPDLRADFIDLLNSYLVSGHPHFARSYQPEPNYEAVATEFREAMQSFVLAHELGHCYLGHLVDDKPHTVTLGAQSALQFAPGWPLEFEADSFGAILTIQSLPEGSSPIIGFAGVLGLFSLLSVTDAAFSLLAFGREGTALCESHPPNSARISALLRLARSMFPHAPADELSKAFGFFSTVSEALWSQSKDHFYAMHEDGVRPYPRM